MKKLLLALIVITCVFLFNCEKENTPPTIQNTSSSPQEIKTGESAQVTCVATDPDGDNLSYTWTSAKGTFPNGSGSNSVAWKAPDEPGIYSVSVTVSDGVSTASGSVSITVEANPQLVVSPDEIDFGLEETQKTFEIKNSGTGTLSWAISEEISWLTVDKKSGDTSSENDLITLYADRDGLTPGEYSQSVTITSDGGNQVVNVSIEVEAQPTLSVTPANLDFGDSETQKTFNISNSGDGTLSWEISENIGWLTLNKTSGSTTTETEQVVVIVNRDGLDPGSYSGIISVSSDGGNQDISVALNVQEEPALAVSPSSLEFGTSETQLTFSISNSGSGTLTWEISENISWLNLNKTSGSTTSETDQVNATVNRAGLSPGSYNGVISISSNGGSQDISVAIEIPEEPTLSVTPANLEFGTSENQLSFSISNSRTGNLTWNISEEISWLSLNKTSGSTTTETDQVSASVNRSGLEPGSYNGTITISSNGGNKNISVTLEVEETASVEGYVYYSATTIPVSGVTVQIDDIEYTTDDAGYFILEGLAIGNKQIHAFKNNYDEYYRNLNIIEGSNTHFIEMTSDIYTHNVFGTVKDDDGNSLQGVTVSLLNPDESSSSLTTTTDATGYYQLPSVPQGTRIISFIPFNTNLNESKQATIFISNSDYPFNITLDKIADEFTDTRDNKTYKTVRIGSQWWMAENLAFLPNVTGPIESSVTPLYYVYGYNEANVDDAKATYNYKTYGVLYNYIAALSACPTGWHLPLNNDWERLAQFVSDQKGPYNKDNNMWKEVGKHLKSLSGWINNGNGTNDFGFTAFPGGYQSFYSNIDFVDIGNFGYWWCSDEKNEGIAKAWVLYSYGNGFYSHASENKAMGFSVRCIKD